MLSKMKLIMNLNKTSIFKVFKFECARLAAESQDGYEILSLKISIFFTSKIASDG